MAYSDDHVVSFYGAQGTLGRSSVASILWIVVAVLVVLWLFGFLVAHVGGDLIHILLVLAVIAIIYNLVVGRRAV